MKKRDIFLGKARKVIRGTVLVEVLISVAILSVSLVLILQSLMAATRASLKTKRYMEASLLLENKMVEFMMMPRVILERGRTAAKEDLDACVFSLSETHKPLPGAADLQTVIMTAEWRGRPRGSVDISLVYYDQQP